MSRKSPIAWFCSVVLHGATYIFYIPFCNFNRCFGTHGRIPNKSIHAYPCHFAMHCPAAAIDPTNVSAMLLLHHNNRNFQSQSSFEIGPACESANGLKASKNLEVIQSSSLSKFSAFAFLTSRDSRDGRVLCQHLKRRGCSGDWRAPAAPTSSQHFGVHCARVHGVEAQPQT